MLLSGSSIPVITVAATIVSQPGLVTSFVAHDLNAFKVVRSLAFPCHAAV